MPLVSFPIDAGKVGGPSFAVVVHGCQGFDLKLAQGFEVEENLGGGVGGDSDFAELLAGRFFVGRVEGNFADAMGDREVAVAGGVADFDCHKHDFVFALIGEGDHHVSAVVAGACGNRTEARTEAAFPEQPIDQTFNAIFGQNDEAHRQKRSDHQHNSDNGL